MDFGLYYDDSNTLEDPTKARAIIGKLR